MFNNEVQEIKSLATVLQVLKDKICYIYVECSDEIFLGVLEDGSVCRYQYCDSKWNKKIISLENMDIERLQELRIFNLYEELKIVKQNGVLYCRYRIDKEFNKKVDKILPAQDGEMYQHQALTFYGTEMEEIEDSGKDVWAYVQQDGSSKFPIPWGKICHMKYNVEQGNQLVKQGKVKLFVCNYIKEQPCVLQRNDERVIIPNDLCYYDSRFVDIFVEVDK